MILHFFSGAIAQNSLYGQGTGPVLYTNIRCSGNEYVLQECSHKVYSYCGHHTKGAGVSCQPPGKKKKRRLQTCTF